MTGLLQRITRVFNANAHAVVDETERPEAMLNQLQRELVAAVTRAGAASNQARAWLHRLEQRVAALDTEIEAAERAAGRALEQGDEPMARTAAARKLARDAERASIEKQRAQAERVLEAQRERTERLRAELGRLKEQRGALIQRARFARSVRELGAGWTDLPEPVTEVVARMEEKVVAEEAAADALTGITPETTEPGLDEFIRDQSIEDELERIRTRLTDEEKDR